VEEWALRCSTSRSANHPRLRDRAIVRPLPPPVANCGESETMLASHLSRVLGLVLGLPRKPTSPPRSGFGRGLGGYYPIHFGVSGRKRLSRSGRKSAPNVREGRPKQPRAVMNGNHRLTTTAVFLDQHRRLHVERFSPGGEVQRRPECPRRTAKTLRRFRAYQELQKEPGRLVPPLEIHPPRTMSAAGCQVVSRLKGGKFS